jgi:hypothetical protein
MLQQRSQVVGKATLVGDTLVILVTTETRGPVESFYRVKRIDADPAVAAAAFRLTKLTGEIYDVSALPHGPECTCEDFYFCRLYKDPKGCKHVAAMRIVGLI